MRRRALSNKSLLVFRASELHNIAFNISVVKTLLLCLCLSLSNLTLKSDSSLERCFWHFVSQLSFSTVISLFKKNINKIVLCDNTVSQCQNNKIVGPIPRVNVFLQCRVKAQRDKVRSRPDMQLVALQHVDVDLLHVCATKSNCTFLQQVACCVDFVACLDTLSTN